ncbi:UPF0047 protein YjbQ [hydrothermal vent metagenome]|uniref:UPF0047 protein YjbQ n=1 Tax=hydrothermal vent metagenome TaxID=652676 RepID=A0A3B0U2P5_9ZZZZ
MNLSHEVLEISTHGQGLYEFTNEVSSIVEQSKIEDGLLTLFCRHTSCSLLIQENADPDVRADLDEFFARIAPKNMDWIRHHLEGPDDMPAHIKTALTSISISIPVIGQKLVLGVWQGIYLFEHRDQNHNRQVLAHLIGN